MKVQYVLLLMLVAGVIGAYCSVQVLGLIPQPVKDLVVWADRNTVILLLTLCFCVACATIVKVLGRKRIVEALKKSEYSACQL